jgi:quercetin dioxygenase-like cupin family protein
MACLLGSWAGSPTAAQDMRVVPFDASVLEPLDPSRPEGARVAVLWGDPDSGPSAMLLEVPGGGGRLHLHRSTYHLVVLEGAMKHWAEGESEADAQLLEPGSYWFQPGGAAHGDSCLAERCLMFVQWEGARDAILAPGAASDSTGDIR